MTRPPSSRRVAMARRLGVPMLWLPLAAAAHQTGADPGFGGGLWHPFSGLDHLAAMLAVGAWSGLTFQGRRIDLALAPLVFLLLLLAGACLAAGGLAVPAVEPMIAVSLLLFGLLLATRARLPAPAAAALAGAFALFHGAAHGQELGVGIALAGMLLASAGLLTLGLVSGRLVRQRSRWWPGLAGLAVSAFGTTLLLAR